MRPHCARPYTNRDCKLYRADTILKEKRKRMEEGEHTSRVNNVMISVSCGIGVGQSINLKETTVKRR